MKRTENLYKELKEKIENLVEFMVSNDLNAADINLEISEEFTLCNVKYKDSDDVKDEFLYLYASSEKLKESYYEKLKLKESEAEAHKEQEEDSIASSSDKSEILNKIDSSESLSSQEVQKDESTTASNIKGNEVEDNAESNVEDTVKENFNYTDVGLKVSNKNNVSQVKPIEDVTNSTNKENTNINNKDNSKQPINFKEELLFQKEVILSVLKEYNLIS